MNRQIEKETEYSGKFWRELYVEGLERNVHDGRSPERFLFYAHIPQDTPVNLIIRRISREASSMECWFHTIDRDHQRLPLTRIRGCKTKQKIRVTP